VAGHGDRPALAAVGDAGLDGVGGVDDEVEEDLVEIAAVGHHRWELAEVEHDVGDVQGQSAPASRVGQTPPARAA
jgi:hypothetical protein